MGYSLIPVLPVAIGGTGGATGRAAAAALGLPYVLDKSGVAVSHTGDTNETALKTITIPAGAIGPNGQLFLSILWNGTSSANLKTIRARFGGGAGTIFYTQGATTQLALQAQLYISNVNNAAIQVAQPASYAGIGVSTNAITTDTLNTAIAQDLVITGELANSGETISLQRYLVSIMYGA